MSYSTYNFALQATSEKGWKGGNILLINILLMEISNRKHSC